MGLFLASANPFFSPSPSETSVDPFGMPAFTPTSPGSTPQTSGQSVSSSERELMDMQVSQITCKMRKLMCM